MNSFNYFAKARLLRFIAPLCLFLFLGLGARAQLSGTYTLGGTGANYASFTALATDLNTKGVSGPVTVNVTAGTYTERFVLDKIPGTSATNTITIVGADKTTTKLTFASTATTNLQTVLLRGTKYVTIKNMTIANTGTTYGTAVHLVPNGSVQAMYNTIDNCNLSINTTSTTSSLVALSITYSETIPNTTGGGLGASYNTFSNNTISGGYYAIYMSGASTASYIKGNKLLNNTINNFYQYACYTYYTDSFQITGNSISTTRNTSAYGLYTYYSNNITITQNVVNTGYYSLYLYYCNYYGWNGKSQAVVANNIFNASSLYNYIYYPYYVNFYHNTFRGSTYGTYMYYPLGVDARNNIFSGSSAMYYYTNQFSKLDYNIYYSTSSILLYLNGGSVANLTAWKGQEPQYNANSYQQDPGFVSSTDAHLNTTGTKPYGPAIFPYNQVDADGNSRCSFAPTIGGDESPLGKNVKPTAGITGPDTTYVGTPTDYYGNVTANVPHTNLWYVDGVFVKDSFNYSAKLNSTGQHTIKVVAAGCSLKDSATKTVYVVNPTKKPAADFISSVNTIKTNEVVAFTDLSTNGASSFSWDITPSVSYDANGKPIPTFSYLAGGATTNNMAVRFLAPGSYRVCFTATNSLGNSTMCKTAYITVLPTYSLTASNMMANDSTGYLYDNGGPTGLYTANGYGSMVIAPCASEVDLIVKSFEMECGYDYLRVFDGTDNKGTALHPCTTNAGSVGNGPGFTGTTGSTCTYLCRPATTDTFKAKSGKMFVEWKSDGSNNYAGFEAYWWSKPKKVNPPVASFSVASGTACVNIPYQFINNSTGETVSYAWDLDGTISTIESTTKSPSYTYSAPGKYTVTLFAINCGGIDTFQMDVTVISPKSPKAAFTVDNLNPTTNDIVYFSPNIKECVGAYKWRFTSSGTGTATFVNKTDATSANPAVTFSDTGCYSVFLYAMNSGGADSVLVNCFLRVKSPYCIPTVTNNLPDVGISEVSIVSNNKTIFFNRSTQGIDDYQNFVATNSMTLESGVAYDAKISRTSNLNEVTRTIWIDWNLDGDFNDAGEKVAEDKKSSSLAWTAHFTVPTSAKVGASVMRIAINQGSLANSVCGPNKYGEYEDYRVYITPDLTKPVITLIGKDTVRVEQGYSYTDAGATAFDNLSGNLTSAIKKSQQPAFDNTITGTYLFSFDVQDAAGNAADRVSRVVIVTPDKTAPDLQVTGNDTTYVAVGDLSYTEPTITSAMDLVDGDKTNDVVKTGAVDVNKVGTYNLIYTVSDQNANVATVTRVVIVQDLIAPVITLLGNNPETHEAGTAYTDAGVTYSDNYCANADMAASLTMTSNLNVNQAGSYTVVYNLTDCNGNKATPVTRTVVVSDTKAPTVSLIGDSLITLEVFDTYKDQSVNASDNYGVPSVAVTGTFFANFTDGKATALGDYSVIYTATDSFGNTTIVTRTIRVVDTQEPVITLDGVPNANVCQWADFKDAGYTLSDNFDANKDIKVTTEGTFVNTLEDGVYSLRYKAEDKSGNVAYSGWRLINVLKAGTSNCQTGIGEVSLDKKINVYPNPSNGKFTVEISLDRTAKVSVRIVNALGQPVSAVTEETLNSGTFAIDLSNQASGVYMIYITAGDQTAVKQIVISR
jgi:PKD repeat protein